MALLFFPIIVSIVSIVSVEWFVSEVYLTSSQAISNKIKRTRTTHPLLHFAFLKDRNLIAVRTASVVSNFINAVFM